MNKNESLLENIRIATPCQASWEKMRGDECVRFCDLCSKNVYNLSGMSRGEAESLLSDREGRVCVRFYRRKDGTVLTQDCPVGLRAFRFKVAGFAAGILSLAGTALLLFRERTVESPLPTMGEPTVGIPAVVEPLQGEVSYPVEQMGGVSIPPKSK